ncbi:MAG: ABC transporter [Epulopiscium sp. Nele67-Bin004]|nr:MAG: ABC transporter [Epulopiscium sp. Nele67-Bin004]
MIDFKNIEIRYGDFVAMKNLNLNIKEGEFFTFLGPSGCGKTTTLRSLVGFIIPYGGTISINNKDITNKNVDEREIGMVFQSYALFPTMNVYENIAFGLKVKKMSKSQIDEKVLEVAKKIDLTKEQLQKPVAALSGGQQQRVALARAIVTEPKILCLDEPLSNLDAKLRVGLRAELKKLQKELNITTLYVTHDQEEALTLSDRIAVFNNGKIEQVGTPAEIYNRSASEFVCDFIGDINVLEKDLIAHINKHSTKNFDENKKAYIRLERITNKPKTDNYVQIDAKVIDISYSGVTTTYSYNICNQTIRNVELNNGNDVHSVGQVVKLYINIDDIMAF